MNDTTLLLQFGVVEEFFNVTLGEWANAFGLTDGNVAEKMTQWLSEQGIEDVVSVPAVQKYRTGRVPKGDRMRAIYAISGGWVTANDFFALPVVDL